MAKAKGVSLAGLTKKQSSAMRKHAGRHTAKHLRSMVAAMRKGKTFAQSHRTAIKKVGK